MNASRRFSAHAVALVPIVLWGSSFAAVKIALADISPLGLAWGRATLGFAALLAIRPLLGGSAPDHPRRGDASILVVAALLSVVAQTLLQAFALRMTTAIHSGWLVTLIPVFTAILSAALLKERFPPLKIVGAGLGFAGAVVVIFGAGRGAIASGSISGDLLVLLSALNWSCYTLLARGLLLRRPPLAVTLRTLGLGVAAMTVLYVAFGTPAEYLQARGHALGALVYLGVGCTGVGWLAWSFALEQLEPGTLTSFQYLQPLVTVVAARAVLGEPITLAAMLGGSVSLAGVFLVQRAAAVARGFASRDAPA